MQMLNARVVSDIPHAIRLEPEGTVALLSGNGVDTLLLLLNSPAGQRNAFVVNDMVGGKWGEEQVIGKTGAEQYDAVEATMVVGPRGLLVTTDGGTATFPRFDAARAGEVRFVRFHRAESVGETLVAGLPSAEAVVGQIEAHVLHRRLSRLERRLEPGDRSAPSDPQR